MSLLAPLSRQHGDAAVIGWMDRNATSLYLPTVALAEMTGGVAKLRRLGRLRDAEAVGEWVEAIMHAYAGRIETLDIPAAREAGLLQDRARALGINPGFADIALGGIAMARGMVLLTRNLRHFTPLGVAARDPFSGFSGL
ncbi:MAG: VapC toxin family PIN domain ribonuclease [Alphaproteobacteria bacterium]|nr:VapC toxin family PIN domain ribonuclease [Alphaproteobacteria bacterium]